MPGCFPGKAVHLHVDSDVEHSVRQARTLPEALKDKVKSSLDDLVLKNIIVKEDEPTEWVNQMSVQQKKLGDIRICIDPRPLSLALKREHYKLPVLDDILPQLSNSKKFSIFDLKNGYHHCVLDDESSKLTCFATPFGKYRWRRLPFGLNVSSEVFQKRLNQTLEGLEGVHCIADDIVVAGNDDDEHDARVRQFLQRCSEASIRLNKSKCKNGVSEIPFMGHVVTDEGLKPHPTKVEAVTKIELSTDKQGVERLRGMVNYLSSYVPRLSEVIQPINVLTHNDVVWEWTHVQDEAFNKLKTLLSEAPVLAYFDSSKSLSIQCDTSKHGLGAVLMQEGKPLAYASRALSDTETRYATIEKEMLAIIFSLEKWHQFTYGRHVTVYSDHKPLESITKKPLERAPKRLQGMLMRALAYDIDVTYLQGKKMVLADTLSRAYIPKKEGHEEFKSVNALSYLAMSHDRNQEIQHHTSRDSSLQLLKDVIQKGWPDQKSELPAPVMPIYNIRDELCISDGLVFRGERLVVPRKIKNDLHIGHSGVDGCLRQAREYVYWPGMNSEIKEYIQNCETYQEHSTAQPNEPLMSHEIPGRPWAKIGTDLFSIGGKNYIITVCYFSNFFEIDRLYDTNSKSIINKLKGHFARYGIPDCLVSDNGPQFTSEAFRKFTKTWGIKHTPSSPHNSKGDGKVESAVKTAKYMLKRLTKLKKTSTWHCSIYVILQRSDMTTVQFKDS